MGNEKDFPISALLAPIHSVVPFSSTTLPASALAAVPVAFAELGDGASYHYIEFFTASIRNGHTRRAYARAAHSLSHWCVARGLSLPQLTPVHVAAFIEKLGQRVSPPTVKQTLAGLRSLFDHLLVKQVVRFNPTHGVRGPRYVVKKGKTPVPSPDEAHALLNSITGSSLMAKRDRALISVMLYTFARVDAAVSMLVGDYYSAGKQWRVRLHEKGGKELDVVTHHALEEALDIYIDAAGIREQKKFPLFRTSKGWTDVLSTDQMSQSDAWRMLQRRSHEAGIDTAICNHSFRAFGITAYLKNGGQLQIAQQIAGHSDPRTTKLYDRTEEDVSRSEVERIIF